MKRAGLNDAVSVLAVLRHDHLGGDPGYLEDGGHFVLPDLLGSAMAAEWVDEDEEAAGAVVGRVVEEGGEGGEPPADDLSVGVAQLYLLQHRAPLPTISEKCCPPFLVS